MYNREPKWSKATQLAGVNGMIARSIDMLAILVSGLFLLLVSAHCPQARAQKSPDRTAAQAEVVQGHETPSAEGDDATSEVPSRIETPPNLGDSDDAPPEGVEIRDPPPPVISTSKAPSESDDRPHGTGAGSHRYNIDVTPKTGPVSETPGQPYRNDYLFTPEKDWFIHNIPVWDKVLDGIKGAPGIRYLEVGCFEGRSAVWMLENVLTHESASLTCIDPFLPRFGGGVTKNRFLSNVRLAGADDRLELIVGYSQIESRRLPLDSFDVIYIDGDHSAAAVLEDAILAWRLLRQGGLLIFDDYAWRPNWPLRGRPRMGIDFFVEVFRPQVKVIHWDYQLILRKAL